MRILLAEALMFICCYASAQDTGRIIYVVERRACFPGGDDSMKAFIYRNAKLPRKAKRHHYNKAAHVSALVLENGVLTNISSLHDLKYGLDEEAKRLVSIMPRWMPAERNHVPLKSLVEIQILFSEKRKKVRSDLE